MQHTITQELQLIWRAHLRAGLNGKMCLYSLNDTRPWPPQTKGVKFWFGPDEIPQAVEFYLKHYNKAVFPYTALLLNPIVHRPISENEYEPLGSAICWAMGLTIANVSPDKMIRVKSTGVTASYVTRLDAEYSGMKILGFSKTPLPPQGDDTVRGCRALYNLTNISGDDYWPYYLLSGLNYMSNVGSYLPAPLSALCNEPDIDTEPSEALFDKIIDAHTVEAQSIEDAALCWERYDRHPVLYERFGNNVPKLDDNLKFYYYCARDFELFDAIGPMSVKKKSQDEGFGFLVKGLIPRGSIVLLAGSGGTGKSSLAHELCCLAATDWRDDEQPLWLNQPIDKKQTGGVCVYFSGEDGPPIINARNEIFDPQGRAQRLMFQRNYFTAPNGDEITFAQYLNRLRNMPEVPLLVIDPARKYLTGDEDDAAVVSEFFEAIEKFAHERNTSVIVVHHLSKGAKPTSVREVLDELRGSQVFIDRPRVVIGMFREGPKTVAGLAKCNIPPSLGMVTQEMVFSHNPQTLGLTLIGTRDPFHIPETAGGEE